MSILLAPRRKSGNLCWNPPLLHLPVFTFCTFLYKQPENYFFSRMTKTTCVVVVTDVTFVINQRNCLYIECNYGCVIYSFSLFYFLRKRQLTRKDINSFVGPGVGCCVVYVVCSKGTANEIYVWLKFCIFMVIVPVLAI